jgi:ribonuclease HI
MVITMNLDAPKDTGATTKTVYIYSDGACSGNPGPGGWGAILRYGKAESEISGGETHTTNNRMELTGVIEALSRLKYPCKAIVQTDSRYVVDGIMKGWAKSWKRNNWVKSDKKPALNPDLWEKLLSLCETHEVEFNWIKGHAGHAENERCDELARQAIKKT